MSHRARLAAPLVLVAGLALPSGATAVDKCGRVDVSAFPRIRPTRPSLGLVTLPATAVEDVVFNVTLDKDITGEHVLTLEVYLPEGGLYQTLSQPVSLSGGEKSGAGKRRVEGYPFPLDLVRATAIASGPDSGKRKLDVTMPLAGTAIVSNSLYGDWGVDLYLDDAQEPCAERLGFRIVP